MGRLAYQTLRTHVLAKGVLRRTKLQRQSELQLPIKLVSLPPSLPPPHIFPSLNPHTHTHTLIYPRINSHSNTHTHARAHARMHARTQVEVRMDKFTAEEQDFYNSLYSKSQAKFNTYVESGYY
jgi:hypothetical protein